jgi:Fe-S cluster assembly ATP-binding protein
MGPNGSGKSTLAYALAGHPKYTVTSGLGHPRRRGRPRDERRRAGPRRLFLAMQYPVEVPGVSVSNFLRTAVTAVDGEAPKLRTWVKDVKAAMAEPAMDPSFAERNVNEGFSGGEKKRHEILQLELLNPKFAVLDETDSGLDVDALRVVSEGVNRAKEATGEIGVLLITHYTRILRYIRPDFVHVFVDGRIVERAARSWPSSLEADGYDRFTHRPPWPDDPPPSRRGAARIRGTSRSWSAHRARRAPAGLPRLRRHLAEAAVRCSTPSATSTRTTQRRCAPRGAPALRGGHRRLRGRPGGVASFIGARATGGRVHRNATEASTWSPTPSRTRTGGGGGHR